MLIDIVARIEMRLKELGLSARKASLEAGLSEDAIRNLRRAAKDSPGDRGTSTQTLQALAPVLQTTVAWLVGDEDDDFSFYPNRRWIADDGIPGVPLRGDVQAGTFIDVDLYSDNRRDVLKISVDLRYVGLTHYAWRVRGDSMDRAGIIEGMYIVGVDYFEFEDKKRPLREGEVVVVERSRFSGQEKEITVKRVKSDRKGMWFVPDSFNTAHKPIFVPHEVDRDPSDESTEVKILAVVVSAQKFFGDQVVFGPDEDAPFVAPDEF